MSVCCRCNASGKCRNCVCIKSKRRCSNCLPSRKGCCSNMKLLPALQAHDATHARASPASVASPSHSRQPCGSPSSVATTTTAPAAHTSVTSATIQKPVDSSPPPNNAHPMNPATIAPAPVQAPFCPLPSSPPLSNPSFVWGENDAVSIMASMDEAYSEVIHWRINTFPDPLWKCRESFCGRVKQALQGLYRRLCTRSNSIKGMHSHVSYSCRDLSAPQNKKITLLIR